MKQAQGTCKYCGQIRTFMVGNQADDSELDNMATRECNCTEGKKFREKEATLYNATDKIEKLFGEDTVIEARELMMLTAKLLANGIIKNVTIALNEVVKAKLKVGANDKISVVRSESVTYKLDD